MTRATLPERLETERLVLRVRTVADVVDIFDYASRPEVSYPAGFPPAYPSSASTASIPATWKS